MFGELDVQNFYVPEIYANRIVAAFPKYDMNIPHYANAITNSTPVLQLCGEVAMMPSSTFYTNQIRTVTSDAPFGLLLNDSLCVDICANPTITTLCNIPSLHSGLHSDFTENFCHLYPKLHGPMIFGYRGEINICPDHHVHMCQNTITMIPNHIRSNQFISSPFMETSVLRTNHDLQKSAMNTLSLPSPETLIPTNELSYACRLGPIVLDTYSQYHVNIDSFQSIDQIPGLPTLKSNGHFDYSGSSASSLIQSKISFCNQSITIGTQCIELNKPLIMGSRYSTPWLQTPTESPLFVHIVSENGVAFDSFVSNGSDFAHTFANIGVSTVGNEKHAFFDTPISCTETKHQIHGMTGFRLFPSNDGGAGLEVSASSFQISAPFTKYGNGGHEFQFSGSNATIYGYPKMTWVFGDGMDITGQQPTTIQWSCKPRSSNGPEDFQPSIFNSQIPFLTLGSGFQWTTDSTLSPLSNNSNFGGFSGKQIQQIKLLDEENGFMAIGPKGTELVLTKNALASTVPLFVSELNGCQFLEDLNSGMPIFTFGVNGPLTMNRAVVIDVSGHIRNDTRCNRSSLVMTASTTNRQVSMVLDASARDIKFISPVVRITNIQPFANEPIILGNLSLSCTDQNNSLGLLFAQTNYNSSNQTKDINLFGGVHIVDAYTNIPKQLVASCGVHGKLPDISTQLWLDDLPNRRNVCGNVALWYTHKRLERSLKLSNDTLCFGSSRLGGNYGLSIVAPAPRHIYSEYRQISGPEVLPITPSTSVDLSQGDLLYTVAHFGAQHCFIGPSRGGADPNAQPSSCNSNPRMYDVAIYGNLRVLGRTTSIDSKVLCIEDKDVQLAKYAYREHDLDGLGFFAKGPMDINSPSFENDECTHLTNHDMSGDCCTDNSQEYVSPYRDKYIRYRAAPEGENPDEKGRWMLSHDLQIDSENSVLYVNEIRSLDINGQVNIPQLHTNPSPQLPNVHLPIIRIPITTSALTKTYLLSQNASEAQSDALTNHFQTYLYVDGRIATIQATLSNYVISSNTIFGLYQKLQNINVNYGIAIRVLVINATNNQTIFEVNIPAISAPSTEESSSSLTYFACQVNGGTTPTGIKQILNHSIPKYIPILFRAQLIVYDTVSNTVPSQQLLGDSSFIDSFQQSIDSAIVMSAHVQLVAL